MEQIGGNNAVFRLACLLFLEFFLVLLFFDYSLLLDISQFEPFAREIFYKTVMFNFTDNEIKSFRFRFDLGQFEWFLRVSSQFEITKRIVSLDFFFHMKMYASSIFCNRSLLPPRGGKKIMIDRCFFILMEANDRYKLIAWWGSNDIMIKREKRDGRVTFKSHDVIKNRKRIKYSGVCVINDYVEARVFLEFVAYFY